MKLTLRQQQIVDLRHSQDPPLSWREIARRLGSTKSNISSLYSRAMARMKEPEPKHPKVRADAVESKRPELVADVIDIASDPFETVAALARKVGLPETTTKRLLKRLETRYGPLVGEVKGVKAEVLRDLFSYNAHRALQAVSDQDIAVAGLKDKAIAAGIFTEKYRLLSGLATQNISIEQRAYVMEELAPMILREMQRRGLSQVVDPESGAVRVEELRGYDDAIDVTPDPPRVSERPEPPSD